MIEENFFDLFSFFLISSLLLIKNFILLKKTLKTLIKVKSNSVSKTVIPTTLKFLFLKFKGTFYGKFY